MFTFGQFLVMILDEKESIISNHYDRYLEFLASNQCLGNSPLLQDGLGEDIRPGR
jgi:hypothetical protein